MLKTSLIVVLACALCTSIANGPALGDETKAREIAEEKLQHSFNDQVLPLLKSHCISCHGTESPEAMLDLAIFRSVADVNAAHPTWELILSRVAAGEMPPPDAEPLAEAERAILTQWINDLRHLEASKNAGDPGVVLPHRLSNAEFDYSIRDLTGVDIRPTKTFPVDPANESGFDNTGESLTMSPALLQKYLEAARTVTEYLVLTPQGIRFAPHPVVTDTDRDRYCVKRIVEFYQQQPTRYADYFTAAWRFQHRTTLGQPQATLEDIATEAGLSPKYLAIVWEALTGKVATVGPMQKLQALWRALPQDNVTAPETYESVQAACKDMDKYVTEVRELFEPKFDNLKIREVHDGAQPFVLWKNNQYANHRRQADFSFLDTLEEPSADANKENPSKAEKEREKERTRIVQKAEELIVAPNPGNAEAIAQFKQASQEFCSIFPDAFYISERGRDYLGVPKDQQEKGRLLSAGFHSMTGYFRDDKPLFELILDEAGQRELDALWQELDFFAAAPQRQYQGFLWFERTDSRFMRDEQFDFARPEDKIALEQESVMKLGELYAAKAASKGGDDVPLQAIRDYFTNINQQIRWVEEARVAAEPRQLEAVIEFAQRAFRRPLSTEQQSELRSFYRQLRDVDQLSHEEAIQDTLISVLMSPNFLYRIDLLSDSASLRPLDDFELASRLSYFLWSSGPDEELLQLAEAGKLHEPEVLRMQTERMLQDARVLGLVTEFVGNWLDFRRFEEHNSVDRNRFTTFDDALRSAMYEEPIRFSLDVIQHDRSILDYLYADRTFVNAPLAKHYGMSDLARRLKDGEWREVEKASRFGRGGLLPMAVFLTKNAPGLRTSPVKRGYWVVRRLLGERIPAPPPNVPDLPEDESQLGELTLRETLAKHRDHASCAGCHNRFDAIGLVFEGFGPVGERREKDLGDRPVDTRAAFPDGSDRNGVADLKAYLQQHRESDFVDNLCKKLLSYALSRSLQLSDEILVDKMRSDLQANDYRFNTLIHAITTSPQFLNKRGQVL